MNDYAKMTSLQAQEEMEKFREVFNVVRLIDAIPYARRTTKKCMSEEKPKP